MMTTNPHVALKIYEVACIMKASMTTIIFTDFHAKQSRPRPLRGIS